MRITVAPVPPSEFAWSPAAAIIIDVLRATTTLTTVLERGAQPVFVTASADAAREYRHARPGTLFLGQSAGITLADADLGNSPVVASQACLDATAVVAYTTNGTAAIASATTVSLVLLGCLRNATAVARESFDASLSSPSGVAIVCAGARGGSSIARDDLLVAGLLAVKLERLARVTGGAVVLDAGAKSAVELVRAAGLDGDNSAVAWRRQLAHTESGLHLRAIGRDDDVAYAAEVDASTMVPRVLSTTAGGALVEVGSGAAMRARLATSMQAVACN